MLDLFTKHPEAKLKLAQAVAGSIAIPLNVATKEDLKQFATKEDLKQLATKQDLDQLKRWAEEKFATKQDLETAVEQLKKWAEERFVTKEHFDAVVKRLEDKMAIESKREAVALGGGAGSRRLAGPQMRVDGGGAFGGGTAQAGPRPCAHPPCTSM